MGGVTVLKFGGGYPAQYWFSLRTTIISGPFGQFATRLPIYVKNVKSEDTNVDEVAGWSEWTMCSSSSGPIGWCYNKMVITYVISGNGLVDTAIVSTIEIGYHCQTLIDNQPTSHPDQTPPTPLPPHLSIVFP